MVEETITLLLAIGIRASGVLPWADPCACYRNISRCGMCDQLVLGNIAVNVLLGTDPFNAFDIRVKADSSILNPTSVDLTGSVLVVDSATLKAECINGMGSGCVAPLDGPGVVRVSVNDTGASATGASGLLFAVTFHVVGLATDSVIGYQTGCSARFGLCLLLTHPFTCFEGNCTTIAAEDPAFAVFGNLPALLPGYPRTASTAGRCREPSRSRWLMILTGQCYIRKLSAYR